MIRRPQPSDQQIVPSPSGFTPLAIPVVKSMNVPNQRGQSVALRSYLQQLLALDEREIRDPWGRLLQYWNEQRDTLGLVAEELAEFAARHQVLKGKYSGSFATWDNLYQEVHKAAKNSGRKRDRAREAQNQLTRPRQGRAYCSQEFMDYVIIAFTGGAIRAMDVLKRAHALNIEPVDMMRAGTAWMLVRRSGIPDADLTSSPHPYVTPGDLERSILNSPGNQVQWPSREQMMDPRIAQFTQAHNLRLNHGVWVPNGDLPEPWLELVRNGGRTYLPQSLPEMPSTPGSGQQAATRMTEEERTAMLLDESLGNILVPSIEEGDQDSSQRRSMEPGEFGTLRLTTDSPLSSVPSRASAGRDRSISTPSQTYPTPQPPSPRKSGRLAAKKQPDYKTNITGSKKDPHPKPPAGPGQRTPGGRISTGRGAGQRTPGGRISTGQGAGQATPKPSDGGTSTKRPAKDGHALNPKPQPATDVDKRVKFNLDFFRKLHVMPDTPTRPPRAGPQYTLTVNKKAPTPLQQNLLTVMERKFNGVIGNQYIPPTEAELEGIRNTNIHELLQALEDLCMVERPISVKAPSSVSKGLWDSLDATGRRMFLEGARDVAEIAYAAANDSNPTMQGIRDIVAEFRRFAPREFPLLTIGNGNEFANGAQFVPADFIHLIHDSRQDGWLNDSIVQAAMAAILYSYPPERRPHARIMPGWDFDNLTQARPESTFSSISDHLPFPGQEDLLVTWELG